MSFLRKCWKWIGENSGQLQAVGAILAVVVVIFGVPRLKPSAEVTILVRTTKSTLTPALVKWFSEASEAITSRDFTEVKPEKFDWELRELKYQLEGLQKLRETVPWKATDKRSGTSVAGELDRTLIVIRNRTERELSNIRVRLDGVRSPWGAELQAELATSAEVGDWQKRAEAALAAHDLRSVVFPNLPPLAPGTEASIRVYGDVDFDVSVRVTGASSEILQEATVVDAWPASLAIHADRYGWLVCWYLFVALLLAWWWVRHLRQEAQRRAAPAHATQIAGILLDDGHDSASALVLSIAASWGARHEELAADPKFARLYEPPNDPTPPENPHSA